MQNTFSFNKSKINQSDLSYLKEEFSAIGVPDQSKTILVEKAINDKNDKNGFKSMIDDKNRLTITSKNEIIVDPINVLHKQNVLLDKKAELFEKRII